MGISTVQTVADAAEALLAMRPATPDSELELMETVHRSVDVVSLLIHDAGRRRQGTRRQRCTRRYIPSWSRSSGCGRVSFGKN